MGCNSIIPPDAAESRAVNDRVCAHSARDSGVAEMYDQAGGAGEMAHEAYLPARFKPAVGMTNRRAAALRLRQQEHRKRQYSKRSRPLYA